MIVHISPASDVSALHRISCTHLPLILVLLPTFLQIRQNLGRIIAGDCGKLTGLETLLRKNGVLGLGGSTAGSPSIFSHFLQRALCLPLHVKSNIMITWDSIF